MKRKEAIEVLKNTLPYTSEFAEARTVAIRSLEVLDEIQNSLNKGLEVHEKDYEDDPNEYYRGWADAFSHVTIIIGSVLEEVEE